MDQKLSDVFKNRADLRKEEPLAVAVYADFNEHFIGEGNLKFYHRDKPNEQIAIQFTTWRVTMTRKNASHETGTYNRNTNFDFIRKEDADEFRRLSQISSRPGGTIKKPFSVINSANIRELAKMIEKDGGKLPNLKKALHKYRGSIMGKDLGLI